VPGLLAPAEIRVDRWGVPHIYAGNERDAFFVQGWNAARERLFQIDLWRRRGLGQLAEVLGSAYVEQDKAARLFLYRGDMTREWRAYSQSGHNAERIATAFVAGINAHIDWLEANPSRLPPEFKLLGYRPAKWSPEDVVRIRSHGLTRNLRSEVARANVACRADLKSDGIRVGLQPSWETRIPEGLDPCLPKDVLRVFDLATQGVRLTRDNLKTSGALRPEAVRIAADERVLEALEGSNSWVIAPRKSATGRPIMANDPHRAYTTPSLRYIAHVVAPGLNVIGAGEPALPGISVGHNGTIAFGLTIFSIDQEDLYVYELNPANADEYRYGGRWEPVRTISEVIRVKGAPPVIAMLKFTRHGPLIYTDTDKDRGYAVRSCWLEPGMAPYFGAIDYMRAKNFEEFRRSMRHWGAPTENQVYADTSGNTGWVPGGLAPVRVGYDGLLPVPGDGRYEWAGFWSGDQMPWALNPKPGWLATANEMNLPADFPYRLRMLGFEWTNGSRYSRIAEILSRPGKVSIADSMRLQNDIHSIPARRLVTLLAPLASGDARTQAALDLLRGWHGVQRTDSAQAALMEVWFSRHLGRAFKEAVLSKAAADAMGPPDAAVMLDTLEKPEARFGPNATELRNEVLLGSLAAAWAETEKLLGTDPRQWQWGKLHHNLPEHALSAALDEATRAKFNVGPLAKGGSAYTPNQSTYRVSDFRHINGASFRIVVDVGNWDNTRAVNHPGQSGNPDSPHYRDLAPLWQKGEYFPLAYSRQAVVKATEYRIVLTPQAQPDYRPAPSAP
jgi:penicillin amidase